MEPVVLVPIFKGSTVICQMLQDMRVGGKRAIVQKKHLTVPLGQRSAVGKTHLIPNLSAAAQKELLIVPLGNVYPKVKVREQEEDDPIAVFVHERPLEDLESLPINDHSSSARESEDDSPRSVMRIPKPHTSNSVVPMTPLPKENKSDHKAKDGEDNKQNVKAASVLRPRAVLSSPDNDGVIGNRNKAKAELLSGLKNHNMCQDRHTRCKVTPIRSTNENSITKKGESKEAADSKSEVKETGCRVKPRRSPDENSIPKKGESTISELKGTGCKVTLRRSPDKNSITKKGESKEAADSKSELKGTGCKVTPRRSTHENSITKKGEFKEAADSKSELRGTGCKVTPKRSTTENSRTKKGESKEAVDSESKLKGRRQVTIADPLITKKTTADPAQRLHLGKGKIDSDTTQRGHLRKGKPDAEVKP